MSIIVRALMLATLSLTLIACQTPEQMAEKEAMRAAETEANEAKQAAEAEAKMAAYEEKLPGGFEQLTGDSLLKTVSDTTVTGVSSTNTEWTFMVYRSANGEMKGESTNGTDKSQDSGKWWIESESVCSQWNQWLDGKPICNRLYSNGDYHMTIGKDGTIQDGKKLKWTIESGNAANL